jgi:hypothetical protein
MCSLDNVSLGQCGPWTMHVSVGQCVPRTMFPWDNVSLGQYVPWTLCPLDNASHGQCVSWKMCPLDNVSLGKCVPWTMCPLENVSLGQCVPWKMCPLDNVSRGQYVPMMNRPWSICPTLELIHCPHLCIHGLRALQSRPNLSQHKASNKRGCAYEFISNTRYKTKHADESVGIIICLYSELSSILPFIPSRLLLYVTFVSRQGDFNVC